MKSDSAASSVIHSCIGSLSALISNLVVQKSIMASRFILIYMSASIDKLSGLVVVFIYLILMNVRCKGQTSLIRVRDGD